MRMDSSDLDLYLTHCSLCPNESVLKTAYRSVQPFLQGLPIYINLQNPMLYNAFQWTGQSRKVPLPVCNLDPNPSNRAYMVPWVHGPPPNDISIG